LRLGKQLCLKLTFNWTTFWGQIIIRNSFSSFHIHIDILANDHFFSLGLIAPPNLVVIAALLVADVSMTAAILLTLELDQLYGGLVHI